MKYLKYHECSPRLTFLTIICLNQLKRRVNESMIYLEQSSERNSAFLSRSSTKDLHL